MSLVLFPGVFPKSSVTVDIGQFNLILSSIKSLKLHSSQSACAKDIFKSHGLLRSFSRNVREYGQ